jgi:preprotein translocase subunit YajC
MSALSSLFAGAAFAADTAQAVQPAADATSSLMRFLPLFLIFGVFYFLLIRPQQKKLDAQAAMLKALKKGDKVITGGGLIGTIAKLDGDDYAFVEIAKDIQVKVMRSTISGLVDEGKQKTETPSPAKTKT